MNSGVVVAVGRNARSFATSIFRLYTTAVLLLLLLLLVPILRVCAEHDSNVDCPLDITSSYLLVPIY